MGRSAIRNLLATDAKFNWLLFLDADVFPKNRDFITTYLDAIKPESEVIYGGILYTKEKPNQSHLLRWVYGHEREALPTKHRQENSCKLCWMESSSSSAEFPWFKGTCHFTKIPQSDDRS